MYLIDTNIWLERLLHQEKSEVVGQFLSRTPSEHLFITDFPLHSIGIVMHRLKRLDALLRFVQDAFIDGAVVLIHLKPEDMRGLIHVMDQFDLDFDDAYQYVAAEKYSLTIVSLDHDFDQTERGRKTPDEVLSV
ncbi:MAG: type II toxin-antitoxin system VapC family toxin [Chloroflexi bacterium]|nr:type II toxin-antitoxin system VapC family toxin [Chloroflexota bacterium]